MLKNLIQTAKHTAIYSIGNLSLKFVSVALLPIYTSYLTTSDYGALIILETTGTLMVAVFSFKLSTSMMRWCSQEPNENRRKSFVFTTYFFSTILLILLNLLLYPQYKFLSELFFNTPIFYFYFPILFLSISFEILNLYPLELIRLHEKSLFFVLISILRLITVLTVNIILLVKFEYGIEGVLLGQLTGHIIVFIITLPFVVSNMNIKFNLPEFKEMLKYGIPLVFVSISMMLFNFGDRYIIKYLLNYSQVAIYSLGYQISSVTNMFIIQSFQTGFLPIAYKMFNKPEANRFFSKTLTYYTLIMVIFSLAISVFSKEIVMVFARDESYYVAYTIIPFMSFALILKGIQYMFSLGLHFVKKTKYNAYIVISSTLINLILNFILIPLIGIYGAALATIIGWLITIFTFFMISQKFYFVRYEVKKISILLIIFVILFSISITLNNQELLFRIPLKIIIIMSLPIILIPLRFYEKVEIQRIIQFWNFLKLKGLRIFNLNK